MSSAKGRLFSLGLNELTGRTQIQWITAYHQIHRELWEQVKERSRIILK